MDRFYDLNSDEHYSSSFWSGERSGLRKLNSRLITVAEANLLSVNSLISNSKADLKLSSDSDFYYLAIPYELDDKIYCGESLLYNEIVNLINKKLLGLKYLASTDRDKCCVVELNKFSLDIFWAIASGHLNTPFVIFNESKQCFFMLHYDLPIQIVGFKKVAFTESEVMYMEYISIS